MPDVTGTSISEAEMGAGSENALPSLKSHYNSNSAGNSDPAETHQNQIDLETRIIAFLGEIAEHRKAGDPVQSLADRLAGLLTTDQTYADQSAWADDETDKLVETRLSQALFKAGRSALGLPGTVESFKAMLDAAGLALVLKGAR